MKIICFTYKNNYCSFEPKIGICPAWINAVRAKIRKYFMWYFPNARSDIKSSISYSFISWFSLSSKDFFMLQSITQLIIFEENSC